MATGSCMGSTVRSPEISLKRPLQRPLLPGEEVSCCRALKSEEKIPVHVSEFCISLRNPG